MLCYKAHPGVRIRHNLALIYPVAYTLLLKSLLETLQVQFVPLLYFLFSVMVGSLLELIAFHDEKPLYLHVSPNHTVDDLEPLFFSEKACSLTCLFGIETDMLYCCIGSLAFIFVSTLYLDVMYNSMQ